MIVLKRVIINQTPTPSFCVSALFYHIRKKHSLHLQNWLKHVFLCPLYKTRIFYNSYWSRLNTRVIESIGYIRVSLIPAILHATLSTVLTKETIKGRNINTLKKDQSFCINTRIITTFKIVDMVKCVLVLSVSVDVTVVCRYRCKALLPPPIERPYVAQWPSCWAECDKVS